MQQEWGLLLLNRHSRTALTQAEAGELLHGWMLELVY